MARPELAVVDGRDAGTAVGLTAVSKVYGHAGAAVPALDRISLRGAKGELVCLVGASGGGKSTLLNLISALDAPSNGSAHVDGRTGLLFQDAALVPRLTAAQ